MEEKLMPLSGITAGVAAAVAGLVEKQGVVHLPGGDLTVAWEGGDAPVFMTGEARNVFEIDAGNLDRYLAEP